MNVDARETLGIKAKDRVNIAYSWDFICSRYAMTLLNYSIEDEVQLTE